MQRTKLQDSIVNNLPLKPHGLLKHAPRVGKSRILCEVVKKNKPKNILWVTISSKLRDEDIPNEITTWLGKEHLNKFDILCYKSLHKVEGKYDMIILDEYQEITEGNTKNLLTGKLQYDYILGATGTHPEHYSKNKILERLKLKELHEITIDEAVDLGLIAPYKITTIPVDLNRTDRDIKAGSNKNPFYQTEEKNYKYLTSVINRLDQEGEDSGMMRLRRMKFIHNSRSKIKTTQNLLKTLKGRTLVFSGSIDVSGNFSSYIYNSKGGKENLELFQEGKIDILSCVNSGGIGYTFSGVDNFIIEQVNSDKKGEVTQKICRSLLLQPDYIANIYIIYQKDTVDEKWKDKVLQGFDVKRVIEMERNEFKD